MCTLIKVVMQFANQKLHYCRGKINDIHYNYHFINICICLCGFSRKRNYIEQVIQNYVSVYVLHWFVVN